MRKYSMFIRVCDIETGLEVPEASISVKSANGRHMGLCSTGDTGSIVLENLDPGTYFVEQREAMKGYLLDPNRYTVEVGKLDVASVLMVNRKNINLRIAKTISDIRKPLSGVTYTITKPDGTMVGTYSTDKAGLIELLLTPGEYIVTEVYSPMMKMDPQAHHLVVNNDNIAELKTSSDLLSGPAIKDEDKGEFIGQIIDVFENFLDQFGTELPVKEKNATKIEGEKYKYLNNDLSDLLKNWELI